MVVIELRRLATVLLSLAISLVAVGLATRMWSCGNLYEDCKRRYHDPALATFALLIVGLVCLAIVFILDLIAHCSEVFIVAPGYNTARFILLYLGTAALLVGILVFTGAIGKNWSYFLAVVGTVFATQVAILAIMSSQCVTYRSGQTLTVRTTRG